MRQDRFLIGILAGIGLLVIVSLVVYFSRRTALEYGPEDTADGVTRNYITALQKQEYERAYRYMASLEKKPDLIRFTQPFTSYQSQDISVTGVEVTSTTVSQDGQSALVVLTLLRAGSGPFDQGYRETGSADLVLEGSEWKVRNMPYPFWSYDWSQPSPLDVKPYPQTD
jgi:hypothetical protein